MSQTKKEDSCPVGAPHCTVLDTVHILRNESAVLRRQVTTDTLTGLHNYHFFLEALEHEMERTRRGGVPTTLIMLDLDHFKRLNDTWGHEAGNCALRQTATLIRQAVRKLDIPCRYGGEEFAIILASTPLSASFAVAERIRSAIETTPVLFEDHAIPLTASLGMDSFRPGQNDTPSELIHRTDQQLYRAKESGRNRIVYPSPQADQRNQVSPDERRALFT